MTAPAAAPVNRTSEHRFYAGMAVAILATVLVGFGRTFFLARWFPEVQHLAAPETFFYVHGAIFTAWMLLLLLQPVLVARQRTDLHRKLGWVGAALAAAMIGVGFEGALLAARRPGGFMGLDIPATVFLIVPLLDIALFALLVGLAIARRRDLQAHKRLMLVGTISILGAAVARLPLSFMVGPIAFFVGTDLFLLPLVAWDLRSRGRLHPVTLWGGLLLIASQPFRLWVSGTETWQGFARWLIG
jgi:FtsH-binding integral membrane protein